MFGEGGRHPDAERLVAERLEAGDSPKVARRAGALGRWVMVLGFDFVFRPQPTIYLLWALGDEETRLAIEAAHERAIEQVLEWIEDHVAVIRFSAGEQGRGRNAVDGRLEAAACRPHRATTPASPAAAPCIPPGASRTSNPASANSSASRNAATAPSSATSRT
ncbi:relaxase domain-containing protein [Streptomyces sp. NPDC000410]|uniref:relaxase domain-containing protein n=1 Tax=Streptomyces sp. NPDC000410 TaxID=3154254 RepID=UPI003325601E